MTGLLVSDRCDQRACPWCDSGDGDGLPVRVEERPVSTLAEFIERVSPGFFERGAGGTT